MKRLVFVFLLFFTLISICPAQNDEWTYISDWGGKNNTDFSFYCDKSKIRYYSNIIEVWVYQKYNKYVEYPSSTGVYTQVDHLIFKCKIYCNEDKVVDNYEAIYFIDDSWRRLLPYYYEGIYVELAEHIAIPGDQYYELSKYFCK